MAYNFDENKYKRIFDSMYGNGSYNAGLSRASESGRLKFQTELARQDFLKRLRERQKQAEEEATYGMSKESWERENKAQGKIADKQQKAEAQGRGGHLPTPKNQKKEDKAIAAGRKKGIDYTQMTPYNRAQMEEESANQNKKKSGNALGKLSDFLKSKDTNGDGKRDGLLKALEIIDRPGDAVRTGIKEKAQGNSFLKGAKDGFLGKKNTSGTELNKALGFNPDKDKKDQIAARVLGKKVIDKLPLGEFISPFVSNKTKSKIGKTTAGASSEVALDPLNLIGAGAVGKGAEALGKLSKLKGLKNIPKASEPVREQLRLPAPQLRLNEPVSNRIRNAGLNFGYNTKNTPKARPNLSPVERSIDPLNRGQQYWQNRYEDFTKHVNSNYDKNRLTQESLDDLWSQFAKYDEPVKLDQVVDLAYPKGFNSQPKQIDVTLPKKAAPELKPLQFKRSITPNGFETIRAGNKGNGSRGFESITPMNDNGGPLKRVSENIEQSQTPTKNDGNIKSLQNVKDLNSFQVGTTDLYRLADRLPQEQRNRIVTSLDKAKQSNINHQKQLTDDLYNNVVKNLGIKKGSKESALVQDFGEKTLVKRYLRKRGIDPNKLSPDEINRINLQQLKKVHPDKWQRIVSADKYFREQYDKLIDQVNSVRSSLYPNNPEKIVPKRSDYYHHFNELTGFEGIKNLFDTPANIDPHLEGISPFTRPKAKFQGFMQKRGNGKYVSDAVGGYLKYLQAATHSINVDPVIPVLRNTAKELADATEETRNANKIIEALQDHANDLAGKTNPYDRLIQKVIGRKGVRVTSGINSWVKSNMIVGNLSSALGQVGSVPLGIGKAKQHAITGLADTLIQASGQALGKGNKSVPINQSNFLKERFSNQLYRRFDQKLIEQPKKLAVWLLETADKSGTSFIWNSMYRKGLAKGALNPIKYADDETRKIVAGRGIGEVPLAQKSKTVQLVAPFTLEVGNQWKVLKEMVGEKDATGLMTFLVASYGLNKVMEHIRGSGVSFDPVGASQEGYQKTDGSIGQKSLGALASLNGEIVGNIPGGNLLTNMVNTDKKVPMTDLKYKDLFGSRNPNRFGTGLTLTKPLQDPLYAVMPFGAAQVRKTLKGFETLKNKGVYKGDGETIPFSGPGKELMYPVNTGGINSLKLPLLGPSSTGEARDYYKNERRPLSEKQTTEYKNAELTGNGKLYYDQLMSERKRKTFERKMKELSKDRSLSDRERNIKMLHLISEMQKAQN
ncbi:hypothetical protein [Bacillus sp. 03113]|uniref:hypothetical protein n=1 Tax=Bacillus sp. 03113 TaxID=2578211 RepID=UPI001144B845|nr:hypothetical protein [Bacillus sp. 03113]